MGTMGTSGQLAARVSRLLALVLPHGLVADVNPRKAAAPAFDVVIKAGAMTHRFIVGWAGEGWPSDAERLAGLVPGVEVVAAARLSDGARGWLEREGLGWADETGSADISLMSGLVLFRQPHVAREPRATSMRWTRSTLTVAEAALSGTVPTVEAIEETTGLSRHGTADALSRLEELGFLERTRALRGPGSARRITDSSAFLDAYAKAATEQRDKQSRVLVHRLWNGDPLQVLALEIGPALTRADVRWAVTGTAASILLAPYLSGVTILELYVDPVTMTDKKRLASLLGGRIVEKGHRIEIREVPTVMTVRGPVMDGMQVALPVRVYADLRAAGGRSAEASHHLRETLDIGTAP